MADEWDKDDGYIDVGVDDDAAYFDGIVDFWWQDSTNRWHYAPIND